MKPKKVSARIRQICQVLEAHGPLSNSGICKHIADISQGNLHNSCAIAERLGLLAVTISRRYNRLGMASPGFRVYGVAETWRAIVDTIDPPAEVERKRSPWVGISSIFQIGNISSGHLK